MRDTSSFLVVWLDPGITFILPTAEGFPGGSMVKKLPARRLRFDSWVRKILLGQENPLEKEMATLSSILAWGVPWTEEPGGL